MFITEGVDLPEEVVNAQAKGGLVFFVGAGASMDSPSNLPSFRTLARQLAKEAEIKFDEKDDRIDLFLGSMPPNFDPHLQAHRVISDSHSSPNPTHTAIARVASSVGSARVVTTNFDDHLSTAAKSESIPFDDQWIGPALPTGDDFAGVVHLHGSVLRAPRELVLTDRDFGRAYMTDAWATRFLQKMFERFTVVFIGYSFDDPIMRYLSLGLPSKTRRYVLTNTPDDDRWPHLGIVPIEYPGTETDHSALVAALEAWDSRARMGRLDHRARMREIVEGGTSLTPVDRDYVIQRLRTVDGAKDFASVADTVAWLRWVEERKRFKALFTGAAVKKPGLVLAKWFGEYVADPDKHGAALQTVQRLGQRFHRSLVASASSAAERLSKVDEDAGRRWKTFLATSIDGHSAPPDLAILVLYKPRGPGEPLSVLRAALRPFLALKRNWFLQDDEDETPPGPEVKWHTNEHTLRAHLQRAITDATEDDQVLGPLLEDALNSAYDLLDGYQGGGDFDPLGFRRSAIEPHAQDRHPDAQDALVDALRDFGERGLSVLPGLRQRWWDKERPLFRRLALHLVAVDETETADEKLRWILDRDALYMRDEKHETFQLLAKTLPEAGALVRAEVLAAILLGPSYPLHVHDRDQNIAYWKYNLLAWVTQSAPDWREGVAAFNAAQAANPTFAVLENPDFDHWSSIGTRGEHLAIDPPDFIRDCETDLNATFEDLLSRDYSQHLFDGPDWDEALSLVRRVAGIRPSMGVGLWRNVDGRDDLEERAPQLRRAIIGGWEGGELGVDAKEIVGLVALETKTAESARSISQFLVAQIRKEVDSEESDYISALRQIAKDLWSAHREAFSHDPDWEPTSLALNSWPGELAMFWAREVERRWRHSPGNWKGLNSDEQSAILEFLSGPPQTLDATRPALASVMYLLFAADREFVKENLLPLFSDELWAGQVWGSFLHNPRVDDRMLADGLLKGMLAEWDCLDNLGDHRLQDQFHDLAASVVTSAGIRASDRKELLKKSVLAADGRHAAQFASAVVELLNSPGADGAEVWDLWLRDHLILRLDSLPRKPGPEELSRWADIAPFLGERIRDALDVLRPHEIGLGEHPHLPTFPEGVLADYGPELVAHWAGRIRSSSGTSSAQQYWVKELIKSVRSILGDPVQPILDAARERDFIS